MAGRRVRAGLLAAGCALVCGWLWAVGCAHAARRPEGPALERGVLQSGGRDRTYALVDPGELPGKPPGLRPLLLSFHGRGGSGEQQALSTRLGVLAAREGFVVAFPDGINHSWADARGVTPASLRGVDDLAFAGALIDHLVQTRRVDPRRVYATGMSNGGFFALRLACQLSQRVAAVVAVAANLPSLEAEGCGPARPIPVALVLGTQDTLVPYQGGPMSRGRGEVFSGPATARFFADKAGCAPAPQEEGLTVAPQDGTRATLSRWTGCRGGAEVALFTVEGGGHAWPGSRASLPELIAGKTSQALDASEEAWRFLSRFALP